MKALQVVLGAPLKRVFMCPHKAIIALIQGHACGCTIVSVNFTVRIPRQLYERMKEHREVNWSEVIRNAIEEHLRRLEETETSIPSERLVEELLKMGLKPDMLEPLSPEDEKRLYRDLRERTWERVRSTIQAQS